MFTAEAAVEHHNKAIVATNNTEMTLPLSSTRINTHKFIKPLACRVYLLSSNTVIFRCSTRPTHSTRPMSAKTTSNARALTDKYQDNIMDYSLVLNYGNITALLNTNN